VAFAYISGEEIKAGDVVSLFEKPGKIEFVVEGPQNDPSQHWYFTQAGGGIMIFENEEFGRLFIPADQIDKDEYTFKHLKFVLRGC
jgi:hypothetical protein